MSRNSFDVFIITKTNPHLSLQRAEIIEIWYPYYRLIDKSITAAFQRSYFWRVGQTTLNKVSYGFYYFDSCDLFNFQETKRQKKND